MAVIPGRNPVALIAYYLLGLPAIICGIIGIVNFNANPEIAGKGHAISGIVLGLLGPFVGIVILWLLGGAMWFLT